MNWSIYKLGDLICIASGFSPSIYKLFSNGTYPFIKVEDLNNCEKYQYESREYSEDEKNLIPINSIIFPKRGAAIINNKVRINTVLVQMDSNLMAIYPKSNSLYFEYLYYFIINEKLYKIADTSTIPQINNKHLLPYKIPLPPLPEQRAIAACLSTWDIAIQKLIELIAQKELRKKWLMQVLLTGKKRLYSFEGDIKYQALGKYLTELNERNIDKQYYNVLSVTNSKGFINQEDKFDRVVASADRSNYKVIRKGQFAYNPSRINVGSIDRLTNFEGGILSPMYIVFEIKTEFLLPEYLYYHLKSKWFLDHIPMFVQGSVRDSLSFEGLCGMKFYIPSIEEQTAISQVLEKADYELLILRLKLDSIKEQKQGLMQILLTGKKRLISEKSIL